MVARTGPTQLKQEQFLYMNLLANLAKQATETCDSAKGWDLFEGYIDPTNAQINSHLITDEFWRALHSAPARIVDSFSIFNCEGPELTPIRNIFDWRKSFSFLSLSETKQNEFELNPFEFPSNFTTSLAIDDINKPLTLFTAFSSELISIEQTIPKCIRNPIRERLRDLLDASIEEESDQQDLLNLSSVRSFYGFLELCQCESVPNLSLTWEGHVYAMWRESPERSIGVRFVNKSHVDYAIRNFPEVISAVSSISRFYRVLTSLGLDSWVTKKNRLQAA